jgi:cell division protease FtsH
VSIEGHFLDAIADQEDEEPEMLTISKRLIERRRRLQHKNEVTIDSFLGKGQRVSAVAILPRYYGELLTWALYRYMGNERWRVKATLSYCAPEPVYIDVGTDYNKCENLLRNGQLLVEKGNYRLIVTVDINLQWRNSVQVEGLASMKKEVDKFIDGVKDIIEGKNFYRGKNIEFGRRLRFLNLRAKSWDSIILDPGIKREIKANTIDFLNKRELWGKYGIPSKRGILLAGEPGTGKTAICKALMAEASGITCITTNAYGLDDDDYITELYELAQDLSPCIVFIEDIDLVGQNREEFGYHKGSALLSLLTVLDGIEERKEIVTVATTNCVDMLDKAISERPSRFDRVIRLARPSLEQRQELINLLGQKISMDEPTQDYIARNTEYCTPAQLQEVIYGLVIEHCDESSAAQSQYLTFSADDIDSVISKINGKHKHQIGFSIAGKHNGDKGSIYEP